jgi:hypothetical protein
MDRLLYPAFCSAPERRRKPLDITPISGEVYYVLRQLSGLQADARLGNKSM